MILEISHLLMPVISYFIRKKEGTSFLYMPRSLTLPHQQVRLVCLINRLKKISILRELFFKKCRIRTVCELFDEGA